jgi:hypothetical protein
MKKHIFNLINALVLISLGLWGYFASTNPSFTALIPVGIGFLLALLHYGVSRENKLQAHIAVVLTLLVLIGLIKPLLGSIERGQISAIIRVVSMMATSILAMIGFINSFIKARMK